jgi:hypothetical protein
MSALASLKLSASKKPINQPAIVQQRTKLAKRIWEQVELCKAQSTGNTFAPTRLKSYRDLEGVRKTISAPKRVKPWWFVANDGKLCLNIRYGSKVIELSKGKTAIELANQDDLLKALDIIKNAVLSGELDSQIEQASGQLRAAFKK